MDPSWLSAALDPPRAYGPPLARGVLRAEPEDFVVEEDLGFAPSGSGQHVLLRVRKRDANTQWVARELARLCDCHPRDVGYAGLKDRHAVAVQWFTVPKSRLSLEAWREVRQPELDVLQAEAHSRKLPRGALAGNHFIIRVRSIAALSEQALSERAAEIARRGVPNYFGPQRFGRGGSNLSRIADGLRALRAPERGFVLSAARSLIFNTVLASRVQDGSWEHLEAGDIANLDGRGSIFPVDALDSTLTERCARLDIHPTGPLWGRNAPPTQLRIAQLETLAGAALQRPCELICEAGMDQERRALRLAVRDLSWVREQGREAGLDAIVLRFRLTRGSFATTVLRELFEFDDCECYPAKST
ncbi:MAG TPA: tRNA pseudouridine(13) synthase TruD [Steroidobacteraceae bacterium]|nr:tRNA pseudouridine(13) synthase TruD [Steroidobacteraceae bacterium]